MFSRVPAPKGEERWLFLRLARSPLYADDRFGTKCYLCSYTTVNRWIMQEITETDKDFVSDIKRIIDAARANAVRSVDFCRVQMYWSIGKRIFEKEQQGKERADYGTYLIRNLSKQIVPEYGSGFSVRQLERSRQFYRLYPIASTLRTQLNWSQYKLLIAIPDKDKREYYELEAVNEGLDRPTVGAANQFTAV